MIIHKLIVQCLRHGDDGVFYLAQAQDAIRWIERSGVPLGPQTRALDLGCGHGIIGAELRKRGCQTIFADQENLLWPELRDSPFRKVDLDKDDLAGLGQYDLVVCSNVFEHLAKPDQFLDSVHQILSPSGKLYLSWTNWLSPWGGHEFSPFHYLGPRRGHLLYDRITGRTRKHTPFENLYPTYIGQVLRRIRRGPHLTILRAAPRYYTEFAFLLRIPVLREFFTWNCALLIGKRPS
jgi:2-polyprenyl-3-methyl-5-hydroxy-6-metoxy-1,4-benzoquinol methylase